MANKILNVDKLQLRRDTAENWETNNPVLAMAEEGYETDTGLRKIGDGVTHWNDLGYEPGKTNVVNLYQGTSNAGKALIVGLDGNVTTNSPVWSWANFMSLVKHGTAAAYYPVGTELPKFTHSVYGDITMRVERYYMDANGVNRVKLWSKYWVCDLQFDSSEAFYYAKAELPAGTYNITFASSWSSWTVGTYQFTLTSALPEGGQLMFSDNYSTALTSLKVRAYASQTTTTITEECDITEGSEGTNLGTIAQGDLNHPHRICYGSNNYGESAMRQFLNSDAAAGSVWSPKTNFDRPPSWAASTAGFLRGLPNDVRAVITPTSVFNVSNNVYECSTANGGMGVGLTKNYVTNDLVYLPSRKEVYGTQEHAQDTGDTQFPLYVGTTDSDKIKTKANGTQVSYYWLRTPHSGVAHGVRIENTPRGGALDSSYAYGTLAVFVAFDI